MRWWKERKDEKQVTIPEVEWYCERKKKRKKRRSRSRSRKESDRKKKKRKRKKGKGKSNECGGGKREKMRKEGKEDMAE